MIRPLNCSFKIFIVSILFLLLMHLFYSVHRQILQFVELFIGQITTYSQLWEVNDTLTHFIIYKSYRKTQLWQVNSFVIYNFYGKYHWSCIKWQLECCGSGAVHRISSDWAIYFFIFIKTWSTSNLNSGTKYCLWNVQK